MSDLAPSKSLKRRRECNELIESATKQLKAMEKTVELERTRLKAMHTRQLTSLDESLAFPRMKLKLTRIVLKNKLPFRLGPRARSSLGYTNIDTAWRDFKDILEEWNSREEEGDDQSAEYTYWKVNSNGESVYEAGDAVLFIVDLKEK